MLRWLVWIGAVSLASLWYLSDGASCKSDVYIFPLLSHKPKYEKPGGPYNFSIVTFVRSCAHAALNSRREQIALLLPNYTQFTSCHLDVGEGCDSTIKDLDNAVLKSGAPGFNIANNLDRLLKLEQSQCIEDSMGIILTDIPCTEFRNYPDIKEMFNDSLPTLIKNFNEKYFLHTLIIWLSPDTTNSSYRACPMIREHYFDTNHTDFLNFTEMNYSDLKSHGEMCDRAFLDIRNNTGGGGGMNMGLKIGLIVGCSVAGTIILCLIVFCVFRVRRRYIESKLEFFAEQHAKRARRLFFGDPRPMDEWEITPKELRVEAETVLGTGTSATVYKGRMKKKRDNQTIEMDVAVKFAHLYANQSVRKDMIREIEFMKTLGKHDNLLVMVGCVKDLENPVIATEFCPNGDLLKILKKHELHYLTSETCSDVEVCLLLVNLLRIATQVCAGMAHLASLKYVHRDLAARNVMIMGDLTARVGDFGLCRLAGETLYIQKGGKLPVKHMPYEALKFGEFSEKSDVWAYGILLYEMFTGGGRPFADIETEELIKHLEAEGKPELPEDVPEQVIQLINAKCFPKETDKRGTFADILDEISRIQEMFDV